LRQQEGEFLDTIHDILKSLDKSEALTE